MKPATSTNINLSKKSNDNNIQLQQKGYVWNNRYIFYMQNITILFCKDVCVSLIRVFLKRKVLVAGLEMFCMLVVYFLKILYVCACVNMFSAFDCDGVVTQFP